MLANIIHGNSLETLLTVPQPSRPLAPGLQHSRSLRPCNSRLLSLGYVPSPRLNVRFDQRQIPTLDYPRWGLLPLTQCRAYYARARCSQLRCPPKIFHLDMAERSSLVESITVYTHISVNTSLALAEWETSISNQQLADFSPHNFDWRDWSSTYIQLLNTIACMCDEHKSNAVLNCKKHDPYMSSTSKYKTWTQRANVRSEGSVVHFEHIRLHP